MIGFESNFYEWMLVLFVFVDVELFFFVFVFEVEVIKEMGWFYKVFGYFDYENLYVLIVDYIYV